MTNIFLFVIISLLSATNSSAQNELVRQLNHAQNSFNSGLYFDSITEYKRLSFFDEEKIYEYEADFKIGLSYKAGAKYDDAIDYFNHAVKASHNNDEKYLAMVEIIRTNILRKTCDRALVLLDELENDNSAINKIDEINYWRGWTFIMMDDWKNAAASFDKSPMGAELKIHCKLVEDEKYSVTFAKVISYILPGAGQIYTGEYLSGFLSLGWNVLFGYLTIDAFVDNRAFDGIIVGDLLWLRFYRGNFQNAEKFAVQKNLDISNKKLKYLFYSYKGLRP